VISTNGLLIGQWDNTEQFRRLSAMGVTNYGQMTAGGWMYIGPQGIVHGTFITLLNAGRKYLGIPADGDLKGVFFVTSGLGGMSGAQPKAVEIAGGIGVIAEVEYSRIETRRSQGWVSLVSDKLDQIAAWMREYKEKGDSVSIAYHGNVVDLLEYLDAQDIHVELISDQTSCHVVYEGGYTPAGVSFDEGREIMKNDPARFKALVDESLRRHYQVIKRMPRRAPISGITATASWPRFSMRAKPRLRKTAATPPRASSGRRMWRTSWAPCVSTTASVPSAGCA
jgi:urocanate hydratase